MKRIKARGKVLGKYIKNERNRGRKEYREIKIFKASNWMGDHWPGAKTIIYLRRKRRIKKNKTKVTHSYYLSSSKNSAKRFYEGIRNHWGIENRLHYVKDVTFKEDESKIISGNAPGILSLIRNLVINIARLNDENRIKKFIRKCSGNIGLIQKLLE